MKPKLKTLPNGLRILTIPLRDNPTVTIMTLVSTGSEYETKESSGISHFLEHMCFKGTVKRPNAYSISYELDTLGSQSNAFTSQEVTGYYAKSQAKHFSQILDVVSDIYLNSTFPESEIGKEKGVVIEEMNMYEDMPIRRVQEHFLSLMYGDQPAGRSIIGTKDTVRAISRNDLIAYHKAHYVGEGTVIVVAGDIPADAQKQIAKVFGTIPHAKKPKKKKVTDVQKAPQVAVIQKDADQAHIVFGVRTYKIGHPDNIVIAVLSAILGGGMSSRLFQKLREEMGVAYYVYSANEASTDHGVFRISAGVEKGRIEEVLKAFIDACVLFKTERVDAKELRKVKDFLIGNMKLGFEGSDAIASHFGEQVIFNQPLQGIDDIARKIEHVTAEDIMRVAKKIFITKNMNLALIAPKADEKALMSLLQF
jgi:predicted Zn-dependent peptidase